MLSGKFKATNMHAIKSYINDQNYEDLTDIPWFFWSSLEYPGIFKCQFFSAHGFPCIK